MEESYRRTVLPEGFKIGRIKLFPIIFVGIGLGVEVGVLQDGDYLDGIAEEEEDETEQTRKIANHGNQELIYAIIINNRIEFISLGWKNISSCSSSPISQ